MLNRRMLNLLLVVVTTFFLINSWELHKLKQAQAEQPKEQTTAAKPLANVETLTLRAIKTAR